MGNSKRLAELRNKFLEGIGVPDDQKFQADDFQQEAIRAAVDGQDTLVVAPTGAGKTYIAIEAMDAAVSQGGRALYTTPLKALSNTKYTELKARFASSYSVGLLTGDRKIDTDADLVVATTEIYRNELYSGSGNYSLVVLDEVHFIADAQRGAVWEESIILTPSSSTLLMLSATISNPQEIAEWLNEVRGKECVVVTKKERPVELRLGFLHPQLGVLPLNDERGNVLGEVQRFYGGADLDRSGMRLRQSKKGRYQSRSGRGARRGRNRGRR